MKKLKVPVLVENEDLPETMTKKEFEAKFRSENYEFVPHFDFDVENLYIISSTDIDSQGDFVYAYIVGIKERYYDYAIITTDDFHFRTYAGWKKAVKAMVAQLVKRWKAWVRGLYKEE